MVLSNKERMPLVESFLEGDRLALARMLTLAEKGDPDLPLILDNMRSRIGRSRRIGITGPSGAGKSTLMDALASVLGRRGRTVAIIAVDPSSPLTGGALLGDRFRMSGQTPREDVFIRSMANRGKAGGLAESTGCVADVMDAFGFEVVLVETTGVGQSEVDVADLVHTTVLVFHPGAGDVLQILKAGVTEVADLFVVNKADLGGADAMKKTISGGLAMRRRRTAWTPPVLSLSALKGEGIEALAAALDEHGRYLDNGRVLSDREKSRLKPESDFETGCNEVF